MSKMYTVDHKLLTDTPEIRIGEKIYTIDDRQKTVEKIQKISAAGNQDDMLQTVRETLALALGEKGAKEIDETNYPFAAMLQIFKIVVAAMTGETPEEVEARFRKEETA